jgi:hypothetical protein
LVGLGSLHFIRKLVEVPAQPVEQFGYVFVGGKIPDRGGICGVTP